MIKVFHASSSDSNLHHLDSGRETDKPLKHSLPIQRQLTTHYISHPDFRNIKLISASEGFIRVLSQSGLVFIISLESSVGNLLDTSDGNGGNELKVLDI